MRKPITVTSWIFGLLFLCYNLYLWGGVAVTPKVGERVAEQASVQSPFAYGYVTLGKWAVTALGSTSSAAAFAERRFGSLYPDIVEDQHLAITRLLAARSAFSQLCYYLAPLLILLGTGLSLTKEKPIRSFGGR